MGKPKTAEQKAAAIALGIRLRAARKKAGKQHKDAADWMGVTQPAVSKWESGTTELSATDLERLASLYGVTTKSSTARGDRQAYSCQACKKNRAGGYRVHGPTYRKYEEHLKYKI
jgi:transcriptional regulator with XRE-family HTH domain